MRTDEPRPNNIVKAKPLRCNLDGRILQIAPDRDLVVIGPAASTAMTSNASTAITRAGSTTSVPIIMVKSAAWKSGCTTSTHTTGSRPAYPSRKLHLLVLDNLD